MDALDEFIKAFESLPAPSFDLPPPPGGPATPTTPGAPPLPGLPPVMHHVPTQPSPAHVGQVALRPIPQPVPPVTQPTQPSPVRRPTNPIPQPVPHVQPVTQVILPGRTNSSSNVPVPVIPVTGINKGGSGSARTAAIPRKGSTTPKLVEGADLFGELRREAGLEGYLLKFLDRPTSVTAGFVCKAWHDHFAIKKRHPQAKDAKARSEAFMLECARLGYGDIMLWAMRKMGGTANVDACANLGSELGKLSVLKWAREFGWKPDAKHCADAAKVGATDCLQYLKGVNTPWDGRVVYLAILNGNDETARWAVEKGCPVLWEYDFWKEACQREMSTGIRTGAAMKGSGMPPDRVESVWRSAVKEGNLPFLKWLRRYWEEEVTHTYWSRNTASFTAGQGRLDVLKWMRAEGCPWDENTCRVAVKRGNLDLLKWCHENGCPWGVTVTAAAAGKGRLDHLKWLREKGCPWDDSTLTKARKNEKSDIEEWAVAHGVPDKSKRKSQDLLSTFLSDIDKKEELMEQRASANKKKKAPPPPKAAPVMVVNKKDEKKKQKEEKKKEALRKKEEKKKAKEAKKSKKGDEKKKN